MQNQCIASSGSLVTPVLELYTSEGCSSCPPADQWVSGFKGKDVVVQAFHVGYWDHIGWVDRFASPAHTSRQREIAAQNRLRNIYTPQVVVNGRDWPQWGNAQSRITGSRSIATVHVSLKRLADDQFEATVTQAPATDAAQAWSAYWTVTEHGHSSKVKAGENAGEFLKHDFVVRQYTQAGVYKSGSTPQKLAFRSIAATPGHERQINLVVFEPQSGKTLQALSLSCSAEVR
ncbi:thioredoxin family protein [Polaromonas sp.]|uniref:DUF1223 domain-containing protein n=1 Tax=Polaromonas sp. TaxID=1869339 RepID=UPI0025EEB08D|nr:DUF1223 domain-containing protein [Polaromonas sp.]